MFSGIPYFSETHVKKKKFWPDDSLKKLYRFSHASHLPDPFPLVPCNLNMPYSVVLIIAVIEYGQLELHLVLTYISVLLVFIHEFYTLN